MRAVELIYELNNIEGDNLRNYLSGRGFIVDADYAVVGGLPDDFTIYDKPTDENPSGFLNLKLPNWRLRVRLGSQLEKSVHDYLHLTNVRGSSPAEADSPSQ